MHVCTSAPTRDSSLRHAQIAHRMLLLNATEKVDVLLWECHFDAHTRKLTGFKTSCRALTRQLQQSGVVVYSQLGDSGSYVWDDIFRCNSERFANDYVHRTCACIHMRTPS